MDNEPGTYWAKWVGPFKIGSIKGPVNNGRVNNGPAHQNILTGQSINDPFSDPLLFQPICHTNLYATIS